MVSSIESLNNALAALRQDPKSSTKRNAVQKAAQQVFKDWQTNPESFLEDREVLSQVFREYIEIKSSGGFDRFLIPSRTDRMVRRVLRQLEASNIEVKGDLSELEDALQTLSPDSKDTPENNRRVQAAARKALEQLKFTNCSISIMAYNSIRERFDKIQNEKGFKRTFFASATQKSVEKLLNAFTVLEVDRGNDSKIGVLYRGKMNQNQQPHGKGIAQYYKNYENNDLITDIGDFNEGKFHGQGSKYFGGASYRGSFKDWRFQEGIAHYANGSSEPFKAVSPVSGTV